MTLSEALSLGTWTKTKLSDSGLTVYNSGSNVPSWVLLDTKEAYWLADVDNDKALETGEKAIWSVESITSNNKTKPRLGGTLVQRKLAIRPVYSNIRKLYCKIKDPKGSFINILHRLFYSFY
jgi:hypothetical protein